MKLKVNSISSITANRTPQLLLDVDMGDYECADLLEAIREQLGTEDFNLIIKEMQLNEGS